MTPKASMPKVTKMRLRALAEAVAGYETRFGAISLQEIRAQQRADRRAAIVTRRARAKD